MKKIYLLLLGILTCLCQAEAQDYTIDLGADEYYSTFYCESTPADNWYALDYDDSAWTPYTGTMDMPEHGVFWIRRTIVVNDSPTSHSFTLQVRNDDEAKVYVNGSLVYESTYSSSYSSVDIKPYLVEGANLIAYYVNDSGGGGRYLHSKITTDTDNLISDLPAEPRLVLSQANIPFLWVGNDTYDHVQLTAKVWSPTGELDAAVSWTSSDESVATVENGLVKAVGAGTAILTASAEVEGSTQSQQCTVNTFAYGSDQKVVYVETPGTLPDLISEDEKFEITNLVVIGEINGTDIRCIREMAGRDFNDNVTSGLLSKLDMLNAKIVNGGEYKSGYTSYADRIYTYMFWQCNSLTEVILPATTKGIEANAFRDCANLKKIDLPEGLTYIGEQTFYQCKNLQSIALPASLNRLGSWGIFRYCEKLQEVTFAEGCQLQEIPNFVFESCSSLKRISIPASVTKIGENAFQNCSSLQEVTFAESSSLTTIESTAFSYCYNLQSISLPASVISIGQFAFYECRALAEFVIPANSQLVSIAENGLSGTLITEIDLPESLVMIGDRAFISCTQLQTVNIPATSKLSTIGAGAFEGCSALTAISLPWRTTSIGQTAFSGCSSLSSLTIPANSVLNALGTDALTGTRIQSLFIPQSLTAIENTGYSNTRLKEITVHPDNDTYRSVDGVLYSKATGELLTVPQSKSGEYRTPNFLTTIPAEAFKGCSELRSIVLTANISSVAANAFDGCTGLKVIHSLSTEPPASITESFAGLSKKTLPVFVPIGSLAAYQTTPWADFPLLAEYSTEPSIWLSDQSITLYDTRFDETRLKALSAVVLTPEGPSDALISWTTSDDAVATVADGLISLVAPGETTITASATVDGTPLTATCAVSAIGFEPGQNVYYVTAGNLPNLISEEEKYTMTNLTLFGEINGTDLRFIRDIAWGTPFSNLDMSNVRVVEGGSYYYYGSHSNYKYIRTGNNTLNGYAFDGCTSLKVVKLPTSLQHIGPYTFYGCSNLETVIMPAACTTIPDYTFYDCSNLTNIEIDWANIDTIGNYSFYKTPIEEIRIPQESVPVCTGPNAIDRNKCVVVVPAASLEAYRNAENWSDFYQNIVPDDAQLDITAEVTAEANNSGLLTAVGDKALSYVTHLKLQGSINSYDFMMFRNKMPNLHYLDLTETNIVANPYEFVTECYTETNRLPRNAFNALNKLIEVKLPNSITYVGMYSFKDCSNLRSVTMYPGITTIGGDAFANTALESVDIPAGVSGICAGAFYDCNKLKTVNIGEGLLKIDGMYIQYYWSDGSYSVSSRDYVEQGKSRSTLGGAFQDCSSLESITIPSTVTDIEGRVFYRCSKLNNIVLPPRLRSIGYETFASCSSLTELTLPDRVNEIAPGAFSYCSSLTSMRIPPMVETVGENAFQYCNNLKDLYVYIANAKDIDINQNTFSTWSTTNLHVPDFATASYYFNTQWSQFVNITEFNDSYDAFYTKNDLTLDHTTGTIDGEPDATLHEEGALIVNDNEQQELNEVELIHDGENGSSVIPENEGNITARKATIVIKVKGNRWHFFCFPFNIQLDSIRYDGEYVWRQYDGLARSRRQGGWQNLPAGTTYLQANRGYIFQGTQDGYLYLSVDRPHFTAQDILNHLDIFASNNAQDASWNFVGNPYVSYYGLSNTNYDAPITVWTGDHFEAYRPGDDDYEISPYEAFFVQTPDDNGTIGFNASDRESYTGAQQSMAQAKAWRSTQFVKPERLLINLELTADGDTLCTDKTRIVFNDKRQMNYEAACDAAKFFSTESKAEIYSTDDAGTQYSINERPVAEGKVDITLVANKPGKYSISAGRMDCPVMLIDNKRGTRHNLSLGAYEFQTDKGSFSSRFTIELTDDITSVETITEKTGAQISLEGGVSISNIADDVQTRLYSLNGQLVGTTTGQGTIKAAAGIYVMKVGAMSTKVKVD